MGETIELPLADITLDVDLQPRVKIDKRLVEDYVYAIADGNTLPPVTVVRVGEKNWLADGYHRFHAFDTLQLPTIPADVRDGNALDAVLISLRANAEHGKRRQAGDYRKAFDIARSFNLVSATDSDDGGDLPALFPADGEEADHASCASRNGRNGTRRSAPRRRTARATARSRKNSASTRARSATRCKTVRENASDRYSARQ